MVLAIVLILLAIALLAATAVGMWFVLVKCRKPGWPAVVPYYNGYMLSRAVKLPAWWVILLIIPVVNLYANAVLCNRLAAKFGKTTGFAAGLFLLPFFFYPRLGLGPAMPIDEGEPSEYVFDIEHVTLRFGGVVSLNDVSMTMNRGEILAVIGPNGAGKTSLFNSLTGVYSPQEGKLLAAAREGNPGVSVLGMKTHIINHLGVARTYQNIRLFPALTAIENVKIAIETRQTAGPLSAMLGMPWQRREEKASTATAMELLREVRLAGRANELAGSLAYGEQRRLEIARALGTNPGVLLLDEPAAGTNPVEKRDLAELIRRINHDRNMSVLLIEHDMKLVMSIANRIVVLNFGEKIAEGTPQEIQRNPKVIAAYLGSSDDSTEEVAGQPQVSLIDVDAVAAAHADEESGDE